MGIGSHHLVCKLQGANCLFIVLSC